MDGVKPRETGSKSGGLFRRLSVLLMNGISKKNSYNYNMNADRDKRSLTEPMPRSDSVDEDQQSDYSENSTNSQSSDPYSGSVESNIPPELLKKRSTTLPEHITAYMIEAPIVNDEVHYRTIGNQACAELLQEVMLVSDYDLDHPDKSFKSGRWRYSFEEKDVTVMLKQNITKDLHSVLGIGLIEEPLEYVWETLKNPSSRFHYDRLLKNLKVIDHVDDQTKVIQYLFEKTDCFMKQEREIVAVQMCRKYNKGYISAGKSVEHCQCPSSDTPRVKAYSSGFYLEPIYKNGKKMTKVTYLLQLELKGLPSTLVNYVLKRQPIAIAYIRAVSTM